MNPRVAPWALSASPTDPRLKPRWLPIYHRRTPYNEDEVVHLIHEIVRHYVRLCALDENEVIWPPEGGHALDEALCDELNVSQAARSLIRRLPYPITDVFFFGSSNLFYILDDFGLRQSRECWSSALDDDDLILPRDVQLAAGDRESSRIFLDTQENTIRVAQPVDSPEEVNPLGTNMERPDEPDHYRNFWPRHAPSWLRVQLNKIKALDTIPAWDTALGGWYCNFEEEWLRRKVKHTLEGTYGWPDDFQQDAWNRDRERVWEEAVREYEGVGRPKELFFQ
ncbi:hypothetical protein QBC46DRAFT_414696 [Diplogelasinospora grovesii]|uniref:Uncharacterized protein n=1 Tax=Diplogelasinospora grovesii TaxID=303347 RepID=A0AAN6RYV0_9PEZI|nr:hypothetical protein QBC46DRAFT_414696 [Diplogelasinospora grovesii]